MSDPFPVDEWFFDFNIAWRERLNESTNILMKVSKPARLPASKPTPSRRRYHNGLYNVGPADVYFGRSKLFSSGGSQARSAASA
jgi:hypothetical protein